MTRARTRTLALALLLGAGAAGALRPVWNRHRALAAIVDARPEVRKTGWRWLLGPPGSAAPGRGPRGLKSIAVALAGAGDAALLDGAAALRARGLWSWRQPGPDLLMRELSLRAGGGGEANGIIAVALLETCPLDADGPAVLAAVNALLAGAAPPLRSATFEAACAWAGPARGAWIADLEIAEPDHRLRRLRELALSWCRPAPAPRAIDPAAAPDFLEAQLLRAIRDDADDASPILNLLSVPAVAEARALPDILRHARDPRALRALRRMAALGRRAAEHALQARSRPREDAQARMVLADPARPPAARRLAAWRWDHAPPGQVQAVLALDAAGPDGEVFATALLAERRLGAEEAAARAETWIRSFRDERKRAGALLAALLGVHRDLLRRAERIEDVPAVRTAQRLALWALGAPVGAEDPAEFAFRTLHRPDGDFSADTALCMLVAGRPEALALLTSPPVGAGADYGRSVQRRAWLIERFVPAWHGALGRPIGGSVRGVHLHLDCLEAARLLWSRRLRQDRRTRTFSLAPDATPAAGQAVHEATRAGGRSTGEARRPA